MKNRFIITGLDTHVKRRNAETLLKKAGFASYELLNRAYRSKEHHNFISCWPWGEYLFEKHNPDPKILKEHTLEEAEAFLFPQKTEAHA
jgi:hypothetical protein